MECPLSEVPLYTEFSTKSILVMVVSMQMGYKCSACTVRRSVWGGGGVFRGFATCIMFVKVVGS